MTQCVIIYRGPLERSRLNLVVEAAVRAYHEPLTFIWLQPREASAAAQSTYAMWLEEHKKSLAAHYEFVATRTGVTPIRRRLKGLLRQFDVAILFGLSSRIFIPRNQTKTVWIINGLPEERLSNPTLRNRAAVELSWFAAVRGPEPDLVVGVSHGMGRLLQLRLGKINYFAVPSCTNTEVFAPQQGTHRTWITYLGTGAPWQGIDLMADVLARVAQADPSTNFRFVTRDARVRTAATSLPASRTEVVSAEGPREVAAYLWEARLGLLLRPHHPINQVATPAKFAEYVAAGVPVAATELEWDLTSTIRRSGCGVLVPERDPAEAARRIIKYLNSEPPQEAERKSLTAAEGLSRSVWADRLAERLARLA
jgi:glycosyltransferase involved in cell wall biosynthesis